LITCAKDKHIKVWSFPKIWYDEEHVPQAAQVVQYPPTSISEAASTQSQTTIGKFVKQVAAFNPANPLAAVIGGVSQVIGSVSSHLPGTI
jgi:hypothetical protein